MFFLICFIIISHIRSSVKFDKYRIARNRNIYKSACTIAWLILTHTAHNVGDAYRLFSIKLTARITVRPHNRNIICTIVKHISVAARIGFKCPLIFPDSESCSHCRNCIYCRVRLICLTECSPFVAAFHIMIQSEPKRFIRPICKLLCRCHNIISCL